ncbi:hypothetical protein LRS74_33220 [Streptomyces sp. LX-29]|uniref:hypothetical protein n=1 Tax=Streptomyces sp. LX-29 TaxID=2900152 RepID=UPI00240E0D68|nr:hypothetical protein [Streptomyces sp. LX-29]WFB11352.1 hypothetical protein LRS74_33220 [Streptomyces sp. LX-29]
MTTAVRRSVSKAIAPILAGFVLMSLVGCSPQTAELTKEEVVGVWRGQDQGRVEFRNDGGFELSGTPRSAMVFSFSRPLPGDIAGSGTWNFDDGEPSSSITLRFDKGGSFPDNSEVELLTITHGGEHPTAYFDIDVDKAYGYEVRRVRQ